VPDQDPDEIAALVTDYVHSLAPVGVKIEVLKLHGGKPMLTALDSPAARAVARAAEGVYGRPTVFVRTGGTIGVASDFQRILGAEMVLLGLGLESDRLHSPNEKFDLDNYYRGIEVAARALEALVRLK
jgi:acetylornithine deacetylase/succinyl-diaminopimelate desuccinylase-like protein